MPLEFNADKVLAKLKEMSLKGRKKMSVSVVYTAPYAVYVHEDMEANHPNGGQAKYLEQPARELQEDMAAIVRRSVEAKNGLEEGLVRAGQLLLDSSLPLVPVDTGELRDSGQLVITDETE